MAIHSCRVVEATKKHQKSQYLNVLNHETEKERKYVVFASNNIIQDQIWTFSEKCHLRIPPVMRFRFIMKVNIIFFR